jgi:hypothetical protein
MHSQAHRRIINLEQCRRNDASETASGRYFQAKIIGAYMMLPLENNKYFDNKALISLREMRKCEIERMYLRNNSNSYR